MSPELFINDHSFHGQYSASCDVVAAIMRLRALSIICRSYSASSFCSRIALGGRPATERATLREVIVSFPDADLRRLVLSWLDKQGPYWDTDRLHDSGDWYFVMNQEHETLATDSSVAECAARRLFGNKTTALLSALPSNFTFTPVHVGIRDDSCITEGFPLPNFWEKQSLTSFLESSISVNNWNNLQAYVTKQFTELLFTNDVFQSLQATPFSIGLRDRIITLLRILDSISGGIDPKNGKMNQSAKSLHENNFVGGKSLFSDSSDTEKSEFKSALTFLCPLTHVQTLFPWHGKIKMGAQYRIHFGWPKPDPSNKLPIVYIGPKITKR